MNWRALTAASVTLAWLLPAAILAACTQVRYAEYDSPPAVREEIPPRTVFFEIDPEFHADLPRCVLIMPAAVADGLVPVAALVETELSRHLVLKFDRVIEGRRRDRHARAMSADLAVADDRRALAESLRCDAFLEIARLEPATEYLVLYSRLVLALDVRLARARDGRVIWRARTTAYRSEGGLATSALGLAVNGFFSTRLVDDAEEGNAVISDAVRRIAGSLPDVRKFD